MDTGGHIRAAGRVEHLHRIARSKQSEDARAMAAGQRTGRQPAPSPASAGAPLPFEPPPPYSEAAALPACHPGPTLHAAPPALLSERPGRPATVHSDTILNVRRRNAATPAAAHVQRPTSVQELPLRSGPSTQYDGLTGRRTRKVQMSPRPLPVVEGPPRASAGYDGLSRQQYPPRNTAGSSRHVHSTVAQPRHNMARPLPAASHSVEDGSDWELVDRPSTTNPEPGSSHPRPSPTRSSIPSPVDTGSRSSHPFPTSPAVASSSSSRHRSARQDGPTDLDLLLARIELAPEPAYDDLTLLADFLGPATRLPTIDALDIPEGTVETRRRRVTRDGRVKLKLELLGAAVERCSACLSQFREQDRAVVMQPCGHPVHAECARKWLVRSATCPMCRHDLRRKA